jgi:sulfite oxidase
LEKMPSVMEASIYSGITELEVEGGEEAVKEGDVVTVQATGWAWAGGGRNIVRVDITGDNGETWETAALTTGANQRSGRAWAWVFWELSIKATVVLDDKKLCVRVASKAVDEAFNVQPESCRPSWNVRGLGNNSWYRAQLHLPNP